jgi:DNA mismatch repair protein MutS
MKEKKPATPLLRQFYEIKAQYPGSLLLYRVGDFYETFGEDAITASKVLGIVLTRRASGKGKFIEMAGVPHHALESYLPKLVQAGYKVAVCDQLEDPKLTKKLVKRGVTELVTPGVAYNDTILKQNEHNYLAAVAFEGKSGGVALLDISTGTFKVAEGSLEYIENLLSGSAPKEILVERSYCDGFRKRFGNIAYISPLDEWAFVFESCHKKLCNHFSINSLKGFGIEGMPLGIKAAGAILFYMEITHHHSLGHVSSISRIDEGDFVWIDKFTFRNLEIFTPLAGVEGISLLETIDRSGSPMGARRLREWLAMPIKDISELTLRYDTISAFQTDEMMLEKVRSRIGDIGDLERIISKASAGKLLPREALQLSRGLDAIAEIRKLLLSSSNPVFSSCIEQLDACRELSKAISTQILPDTAAQIGKGDVIARGVSEELDSLHDVLSHSKEILLDIQQREKERTGIPSLRISYNNVFGYFLEVRNTHKDRVPPEWIRKQTLVSAERYITPELKQYEEKILGAEEKILALETEIYGALLASIQDQVGIIQRNASVVARLDVLAGFARLALDNNYCRPQVDDSLEIDITGGRHPVIETRMAPGEEYVPNDLQLCNESQQIIILTGPNMSGKSAFLRQTALIVLMAQIGSFVPAKGAKIGIVDKIFTRVGASDNISRGESTFMVEMLETATILNNLSQRSLVLLDEIGRGTSTYDGMSIAWAIVEYLHSSPKKAKTLFATHYHELNDLEELHERVFNYHISVRESEGKIIFLRKLCRGGVAHSFGIHVARLAGMPDDVVKRAEARLAELEAEGRTASYHHMASTATLSSGSADSPDLASGSASPSPAFCGTLSDSPPDKAVKSSTGIDVGSATFTPKIGKSARSTQDKGVQLTLYQLDDPLLLEIKEELQNIDINQMSPLDAFDTIRRLKKKIGL